MFFVAFTSGFLLSRCRPLALFFPREQKIIPQKNFADAGAQTVDPSSQQLDFSTPSSASIKLKGPPMSMINPRSSTKEQNKIHKILSENISSLPQMSDELVYEFSHQLTLEAKNFALVVQKIRNRVEECILNDHIKIKKVKLQHVSNAMHTLTLFPLL